MGAAAGYGLIYRGAARPLNDQVNAKGWSNNLPWNQHGALRHGGGASAEPLPPPDGVRVAFARLGALQPVRVSARRGPQEPARAATRSQENRAPRPVARPRGAAADAAGPAQARPGEYIHASPARVPAARPPPRTGWPGSRICAATRATSARHQASSSRASSAICARCSRRRGFQPSSSGSNSWRMRLRVKVRWRLDESSRQCWPSACQIRLDLGPRGRRAAAAECGPSGNSTTG